MKRNGNIVSLFQRHAAKKLAAASSPSPAPAANVVEEENREEEAPAANVVEEENQEQEGLQIWWKRKIKNKRNRLMISIVFLMIQV